MNLGAFTIIKNEAHWVGFCVMAARGIVDEFVYFDGNSTDGTPELLDYIRGKYGINIKVYRDQDPKDLQDDYVRVFNECLGQVKSEYAIFLHPDMIITDHPKIFNPTFLAYAVAVDSFAGDPGFEIKRFTEGRTNRWKNIMKNDLGLHYFGHYGVGNEDMYFKDITGDQHTLYGEFKHYPYEVAESGIHLNHYSDVRPYKRRLDRMVRSLENQGVARAAELAPGHPRVSLKANDFWGKFSFEAATQHPAVFEQYAEEFAGVVGKKVENFCPIPLKSLVKSLV